ncbi:hypothetical protein [Bacillus phage SDFMU_Pbc]|uniref:Uncharacterized protein n=1 Tax=Bacillus phage SDFMU_Pbc TaxID=3076135 RepID=A0AA96KRN2_9CAUD|nr:hypothetical protein [Bacillus phage SDFMU_Pbc]
MNTLTIKELKHLGGLLYDAYFDGEGYAYLATRKQIDSLSKEQEEALIKGFIDKREHALDYGFSISDHVETFWAMYDELP